MKVLDHLEEWLIAFLMGGATLLIFLSVLHRYLAAMPIPGVQDWMLALNFSWAQELCIIMFVWMCKFGAAYGVRTGIHVGVDVVVNRLSDQQPEEDDLAAQLVAQPVDDHVDADMDARAHAVRGAELAHPYEHDDAQLLRPAEVQAQHPVLHAGDRRSREIAVQNRQEDDERRAAHQEGDQPLLQMVEYFHRAVSSNGCAPVRAAMARASGPNPDHSLAGSNPVCL